MSVVQECAVVEEAIQRARSLVCPNASPPLAIGLGDIDAAAEATETATWMTHDSSGAVITAHRRFGLHNARRLSAAGNADGALQAHVEAAAEVTRIGGHRLTEIADKSAATVRAGADATSPAAQRVVLAALRGQLAEATAVVDTVRQRSDDLAGHIQGLQYELPAAPSSHEPQLPTGPIVWCMRPKGVFGRYRCSILYPDLSVGTYWSPTDDTNGQLP